MGQQAAIFDFTVIDSDGNALFGSATNGVISESDFQTPDPDKSHDRPWLDVPENFFAPRTNFVDGSSDIGTVTVKTLDVRGTASDQNTGQITAQVKNTRGRRAVLRRWDATAGSWQVVMDGVVHTFSVDTGAVVKYAFHLRDGREFERNGDLFSSNFVLWGEDGKRGPAVDYGQMPSGEVIVEGVAPYQSTDSPGLDHFQRYNDNDPSDGIYYGFVSVHLGFTSGRLRLPDLGYPTQAPDGLYYYNDVQVRWRLPGSGTAWNTLQGMPRADYENLVDPYFTEVAEGGTQTPGGVPAIYMGSTDSDEIPTNGQNIEFQVLAQHITEEHPFFWDGGTLGDLLKEIVNGDHTDDPPLEQYDSSALDDFAASSPKARFILREPVTDRRRWVQENIYKPAFRAPAYNENYELYPAKWRLPEDTESLPLIDEDDIVGAPGEYEDGGGAGEGAIGKVEFTYIRESLEDLNTIIETESAPWWKFWTGDSHRDGEVERIDPDDDRQPWQRLVETEVTVTQTSTSAAPSAKTLKYAPITIRSFAGTPDGPRSGDVVDELGNRLARDAAETVLPRYEEGAATYIVDIRATDTNLDHKVGDWVRVDASWLPNYTTGERGMRRYMQIYGISDVNPAIRKLYLVDGGVTDPSGDPDKVSGEDCFTGGTAYRAPDGRTVRYFDSDGTLENTCDEAKTVEVFGVGGGEGGEGNQGGGQGAAGSTTYTINPGEQIPVRIGSGGTADAGQSGNNGGDTVLWGDANGDALDPNSDTPITKLTWEGGGTAAAQDGNTPAYNAGGDGATPGGSGGASCSTTGGACDGKGAGGGGASHLGSGGAGSCNPDSEDGNCTGTYEGGNGRGGETFTDFGITTGGGGDGVGSTDEDPPVSGTYPGGGGAGNGSNGKDGAFAVLYAGVEQTLGVPTISSTDTTDQNQVEICIDEADWPDVDVDGYRVRVEYATGDSEPAADSGDWQLAGYLEEPGCVKTDALPTGAKVWSRPIAEADDALPTAPGTSEEVDTPETPALLAMDVTLDEDGVPTVTWTANAFTQSVEIRAEVHAEGETPSDPVPSIAVVEASDQSYEITSLSVPKARLLTVEVEARGGLSESTDGLVERDQFNRADEDLNGNSDWEESTAGTYSIVSQIVEGRGSGDGGEVAAQNLGDQGSVIAQIAHESQAEQTRGELVINAVSASDLGTSYRLIVKDSNGYRIAKTGSGVLGSGGTEPANGTPSIMRLVLDTTVSPVELRAYAVQGIDDLQDMDDDLTEQASATDAGTRPTDGYYGIRDGDGSNEVNTDFDEFFVCGRDFQVTGLPSGWKAKIDSRSAVAESSGLASMDVDSWALPLGTVKILDDSDELQVQTTPDDGLWGGDVYAFDNSALNGDVLRATIRRADSQIASTEDVTGSMDDLAFDDDLGLALDYELNPVRDSS